MLPLIVFGIITVVATGILFYVNRDTSDKDMVFENNVTVDSVDENIKEKVEEVAEGGSETESISEDTPESTPESSPEDTPEACIYRTLW